MSKIVMGMTFSGTVPDFGSIYAVKIQGAADTLGINEYGGNEEDLSKLNLITNAAPGSTCLFSNGDLYRLEKSGWAKFGEASVSASLNTIPRGAFDTPSVMPTDDDTDGGEMR